MEEQLSVQELAAEMRIIKSSLLAIQDFLGTLNVNNNDDNGNSDNRDMKLVSCLITATAANAFSSFFPSTNKWQTERNLRKH